jgi:hypothetical protein
MKINKKALELIEKGLSARTVGKLTESQIETLHSKLIISEQVTEVPPPTPKKTYKVGPKGGKVGNVMVSTDPNTKEVIVTAEEGEMKETDDVEVTTDPNKEIETQDPKQVGPSSDDGFGDETDGMGMFESEADLKPGQPNPWAICHAQVGPKKTRKFERCVKSVKKQLEEGKKPVSLFIESQIMKIVEKHLPPRITKGDLLRHLSETSHNKMKKDTVEAAEPTIAPSKPITKPDTKPRTRPSHPGKNPFPGEKEAPRAGKVSPDDAKDKVIDVILNLLKK